MICRVCLCCVLLKNTVALRSAVCQRRRNLLLLDVFVVC